MVANNDFKILVVDDTPELLDITVRALKKVYQNVVSAPNGVGCMEVLRNEKPDIILLDVMLPDANGKDLAKKIKSDPEFSVFIYLLSSLKTSSEDIAEGLEDGADGYIIRPVNQRELLAKVASACRIISAERESRLALLKYQSLFSAMQEGLYLHEMVYDKQGKAIDYRISEANPASEKHLNIKSEYAIGKLATELYQTPEAPFLEIYADVVETGNPVSFDQYFPPLNKHFQISAFSPVKGKFATAFSDITERKLAEEKIELKNKELQIINAEKDKFFSIIAHDLKGPFSGFLGLTQVMAEELPNLTSAEIQKIAVSMRNSANNLYHLLENLLEWSQIQQGAFPFNPEVVQLDVVVRSSIDMILESAKRKNIEISNYVADGLLAFADKNMIQTVIRNLVFNAIKFTPKGGKVTVLSKATTGNNIKISIQDTGIGMSQTMVGNLFRIDVKTNRKGTEGEPSTGLGLLLCKEFVEKNSGRIWVESEEANLTDGKAGGSTFYFTVPHKKVIEA